MAPGFSSAKRKNMQTYEYNPRMKIWRCGDCVDVANIWHCKKGINKGGIRDNFGDTFIRNSRYVFLRVLCVRRWVRGHASFDGFHGLFIGELYAGGTYFDRYVLTDSRLGE